MATTVNKTDTFEIWRTKTNQISTDLGTLSSASPLLGTPADAISAINAVVTDIGDVTTLQTTSKELTGAVNELISSDISIGGSKTFSLGLNVPTGQTYKINGVSVLSSTTLASSVVNSSLTSVGTIATGTWQGTLIGSAYGGTGINNGSRTITVNTGSVTLTTQIGGSNVTLPASGTLATLAGTETLTGKTINLSNNTLTGTAAQFNAAVSDDDFSTLTGLETLYNKTLSSPIISGGTIILPSSAAPSQTSSGSIVWDSTNTQLTVGNGTSRVTLVNNSRQILTGTGLTGGGDLSINRTLALTGQALAIHNLSGTGLVALTGAGTFAARSFTQGTGVTISNGDGVAGNPTISIGQSVATNASVTFGNISTNGVTIGASANLIGTASGNLTIAPTGGTTSITGAFSTSGAATLASLSVSGAATVSGALTAAGGLSITGNISSVGSITGSGLATLKSSGSTQTTMLQVGNSTTTTVWPFTVDNLGNVYVGGNLQVVGSTTLTATNFSVDWPSITSKPSPTITVTATGAMTGTGSFTNQVGTNGTATVNLTPAAGAITLGTHTTGNYVATIASSVSTELGVSGSGSAGAAVSLSVGTDIARRADTHYIGTTSVALNRGSGNLDLTGITSVTLPGSTSGSVKIIPAAAAGTGTILTIPATTGTVVTTGDSGTVTNAMLAGSIATSKLVTNSLTVTAGTGLSGGGSVSLGGSVTLSNSDPGSAQNIFKNFAVSGQTTIAAGSNSDTLTLVGSNVTITTNAATKTLTFAGNPAANNATITIAAGTGMSGGGTFTTDQSGNSSITLTNAGVTGLTAGSGIFLSGSTGSVTVTNQDKGSSQNIFKNFAVSGQTTIAAKSNTDTLTVAAGLVSSTAGISLTTDNVGNVLTISHSDTSSLSSSSNTGGTVIQSVTVDTYGHLTALGTTNLDTRYIQPGQSPSFASVSTTGDVTIGGNLTVNGTTTTFNTSTLDVADINITVAKNATTSAQADGAGLTIAGAGATITWSNAEGRLKTNTALNVGGNLLSTKLIVSNGSTSLATVNVTGSNNGYLESYGTGQTGTSFGRVKAGNTYLYTDAGDLLLGSNGGTIYFSNSSGGSTSCSITSAGFVGNLSGNATNVTGTVAVPNGGTGATTLTGYVKGNGTSAMTASATIPSTDISGLGTMAAQAASSVSITGGTINGTTIGGTTRAAGNFTSISSTAGGLTITGSTAVTPSATTTGCYIGIRNSTTDMPINWFVNASAPTDNKLWACYSDYLGNFGILRYTDTLGGAVSAFQVNSSQATISLGTAASNSVKFKVDTSGIQATDIGRVTPGFGGFTELSVKNVYETYSNPGTNPDNTIPIDLSTGTVFNYTLSVNTAGFAVSNNTSGKAYAITLYLTQDATGGRTVSWNMTLSGTSKTIKWAGGTAPTMTSTANKTDVYTLMTPDGGTTWFGFVGGQNF